MLTMNEYIIATPRLGLRHWNDADLAPFIEMNSDPAVMEYFPKLLTAAEAAAMVERIRRHFGEHHFGLFAVEEKSTQSFIGFTGLAIPRFESFFTPCVEIGWRLKRSCWNQGFATEAARACLQYGFETIQLQRIVSFTSVQNYRSENIMKKLGMQYLQDFDHPAIEKSNPLCRHLLYEINRSKSS